jgi:hypothetical protein
VTFAKPFQLLHELCLLCGKVLHRLERLDIAEKFYRLLFLLHEKVRTIREYSAVLVLFKK